MEENKKLQAYPTLFYNQTTGEPNGHDAGMTLRDYFAAKAMQSIINSTTNTFGFGVSVEEITINSFKVADTMLKQREL